MGSDGLGRRDHVGVEKAVANLARARTTLVLAVRHVATQGEPCKPGVAGQGLRGDAE